MTSFPSTSTEPTRFAHWIKVAVSVWLLLISTLTIVNGVGLSRLTEQTASSTLDADVEDLRQRLTALEQQVDAAAGQPASVSQTEFTNAQHVLENRLARIEEAQAANPFADDLQALQVRISGIETRAAQAKPATPTVSRRAAVPAKPAVSLPPFRVIGVELRGGERFLAVAASDTASLSGVRLLREGETDSGWLLQSIEAQSAVFQMNGQTQRIALQ